MWDATLSITRAPHLNEHTGLSCDEAIRRAVDLTFAAERLGYGQHLLAHMKQIAPCLVKSSKDRT